MKYQHFQGNWQIFLITLLASGWGTASAEPRKGSAEIQAQLQELIPPMAARRLSVSDFFYAGRELARLSQYRELEVRVKALHQDGEWVRVDFDWPRENGQDRKETHRMVWNLREQGPAPFALNQRLRIWVLPNGSVEGFALGQMVHQWRHRDDGSVELQIVDHAIDGGVVLVQMVPDRYSGTGVGTAVYWRGEGLCVGAGGSIPPGLVYRVEELEGFGIEVPGYASVGDAPSRKEYWVSPGVTRSEVEIRRLLADFSIPFGGVPMVEKPVPALIPVSGDLMKRRLKGGKRNASGSQEEESEAPKRGFGRSSGSGWGRSTGSSTPKSRTSGEKPGIGADKERKSSERVRNGGEKQGIGKLFGNAFSKSGKGNKPEAEMTEGEEPESTPTPREDTGSTSPGDGGVIETQPRTLPEEVSSSQNAESTAFLDELESAALSYRQRALQRLEESESPGRKVSKSWVEVVYENGPGEPLRASVDSLPLVPESQFIPESRSEP